MKRHVLGGWLWLVTVLSLPGLGLPPRAAEAADKVVGIHAALVMSQSLPWIAQEAGLFPKYNLDFELKYIASSAMVTAAMLSGEAEVGLVGSVGVIQAFVKGATDFAFIGGVKNVLTHSILARPEIKRPEDLRGKKIGITRIGANTHYFTIQATRRFGLDPARDFTFIQTGGEPEMLAALVGGSIDAAALTAPTDARAVAQGFQYLIYGPDLRIPYLATAFVTRRSIMDRRAQVVGQFMRAMAEATKILHTDKEFAFRVLGKRLKIDDRKVLEAAYAAEIKALERRLEVNPEGLQAVLDEVSQTDARAKNIKPQDLLDRRYLDELTRSQFFDKLWAR